MASRADAEQARIAWEQVNQAVQELPDDTQKKTYRALLRAAGSDILTNGLGQTMAFYASKGVKENILQCHKAHGLLLNHIANFLLKRRIIERQPDREPWQIFFTTFTDVLAFRLYRLMLQETLAYLTWAKRFAEALLPKPETGTAAEPEGKGE